MDTLRRYRFLTAIIIAVLLRTSGSSMFAKEPPGTPGTRSELVLQDEKKQVRVGEIAPPIEALSASGDVVLAHAYKGKVTLIVFWSMHDKAKMRLLDVLKKIRREFGGHENFLMLSVCIDEDWEDWLDFCERQGKVDFGSGPRNFYDEDKWWQLTQAGLNAKAHSAPKVGVVNTPAIFLIGPDNRLIAVRIPRDKLSTTIGAAL